MSDSSRNVCAARSPRSSFCASTTRASQKKKIQGVTTSTMSVLKKYSWLRHIRELENLIGPLVAVSDNDYPSQKRTCRSNYISRNCTPGDSDRQSLRRCDEYVRT